MLKKYIHRPGQRIPSVTTFGTIQVKWANDGGPPWTYHCVCTNCRMGSDRSEAEVFLGCPACIAEEAELKRLRAQGDASLAAAKLKAKEDRLAKRAAIDARKLARLTEDSTWLDCL